MNTATPSRHTLACLAHADLLMLLAELLRGPAAPWDDLDPLLRSAGGNDTPALADAWRALAADVADTPAHDWASEHHRLFEGALACSPNQTAYVRRDKGAVLGDLCGFYRAFHVTTRHDGEKPDHLATQLQFLALLLVMLTQPRADDPDPPQRVVADAARAFADDHLAPWLGLFASQLRRAAALPLYHRLADALETTWSALARHHAWAPLPDDPADPPPLECEPPSDECASTAAPFVPLHLQGQALPP